MATVVVLKWQPDIRQLDYVPVDGGNGGEAISMTVAEGSVVELSGEVPLPLPRVGELESEGDLVYLEVTGPAVTRCSAKWHRASIRLHNRADGRPVREVDPEALGLTDPDLRQQADQVGSFLLFAQPVDGIVGCWECEGGIAGWQDRQRSQRAQRAAEKAARDEAKNARLAAEEAREKADKSFINPYTFVPFPEAIDRAQPAGHHALMDGRLCGGFRVRFECTSPLQAPEGAVSGRRLRLAGASVKGAVRSLHETLAGGCLRVLDEQFVPSYRDVVSALPPQWTLAVVEKVNQDGQPLTVRLCDPVVWVGADQLRGAWGKDLRSGCRVSFDPARRERKLERFELPRDVEVERGGDWVVLLTDAKARRETTKSGEASYFAACGRIGGDDLVCEVADSAWRGFQRAVAGAREVTERRAAQQIKRDTQDWVLVEFRRKPIGLRKAVTGRFGPGDVLWVRRDGDGRTVDGLRLAVVWRHPGSGPMGSRVPRHLHSCPPGQGHAGAGAMPGVDGEEELLLCPSCRLFGAADTVSRGAGETARQRAYAGHVRIGDAVSPGPVALSAFLRAPLGAPRPGAGQFYLRYEDRRPAASKDAVPTREWGARPDTFGGGPRPVRGRKFYWHADPTVQTPPRHVAREHQMKSKLFVERHLAPAGTVLECEVTFDNLSHSELGGLLATFQPGDAFALAGMAERPLRMHLGGGKPLGLGSCRAQVSELRVWSAGSRYGGEEPIVAEPDRYVAEFVESAPAAVKQTWPALASVLGADTVDPALVWYPPGKYWSEQKDIPELFDDPFEFFERTSGMYLATKGDERPLPPFRDPAGPDQTLPIVRNPKQRKPSEERGK